MAMKRGLGASKQGRRKNQRRSRPWWMRALREVRSWSLPRRLLAAVLTAAVAAAVGAAVSSSFIQSGSSKAVPATCAPSPTRVQNQLTTENDFRHGVWTFSSPQVFPGFTNENARPLGAAIWLPNCTTVTIKCARNGGRYTFINTVKDQQVRLTWRLWAQLADRSWLPLSDVAETTGLRQPLLGLPRCA